MEGNGIQGSLRPFPGRIESRTTLGGGEGGRMQKAGIEIPQRGDPREILKCKNVT